MDHSGVPFYPPPFLKSSFIAPCTLRLARRSLRGGHEIGRASGVLGRSVKTGSPFLIVYDRRDFRLKL